MKQKSKSSNQKYYKMIKLPIKYLKYRLSYLPASSVKIEFIQYPGGLFLKGGTGGNFSHLFDYLYVCLLCIFNWEQHQCLGNC